MYIYCQYIDILTFISMDAIVSMSGYLILQHLVSVQRSWQEAGSVNKYTMLKRMSGLHRYVCLIDKFTMTLLVIADFSQKNDYG